MENEEILSEESRYPLHSEIADFDESGNCTLNIDFKDFDVDFETFFNGDEVLTAQEYQKIYFEVVRHCNESGDYTIDCFDEHYTVRKVSEIKKIRYDAMTDEEKAEYDKQKHISELEEELAQVEQQLADMDYIGVKIATGRATVEQYADKIALMNELAIRVNTLREALGYPVSEESQETTSSEIPVEVNALLSKPLTEPETSATVEDTNNLENVNG